MAIIKLGTKKKLLNEGTRRYVDMWSFMGAHPTNIDLFQRLKSGDDKQFGVNMDVCGTVKEYDRKKNSWGEAYFVGIRTDAWNANVSQQEKRLEQIQLQRQEELRRQIKSTGTLTSAQTARLHKTMLYDPVMKLRASDIQTRRLVLKLFKSNTEKIRWIGTIEELVSSELHRSCGAGKPLLTMTSIMEGAKYLSEIQENQLRYRIPSVYTFSYFQERKSRMFYITIRRKLVSIGADFWIETEGKRIGLIDGNLFGFGYNAYITVNDPDLKNDTRFMDLITLFTTSVGYHNSMRRALRQRLKGRKQGIAGDQVIEDEEFRLLMNPRRAA